MTSVLTAVDSRGRSSAVRRRALDLFSETSSLTPGWLASFGLAAITLLDRLVSVPFLYRRATDGIAHALVEFVAACAIWSVVWLTLRMSLPLARSLAAAGRFSQSAAVVALGGAFGSFLCIVSVRYSTFWPELPPVVWWGSWWLLGIAFAAAARELLSRPVSHWARPLGALLTAGGAGLHWFALHHPLRHFYGNLHALVQLAALLITGVGCTLVFSSRRVRRTMTVAAFAALVVSSVALATVNPSFSLRRAALVQGGVGKLVVLQIVWPLLDTDGDSSPDRFWGVDRSEGDRRRTALSQSAEPALIEEPLDISLRSGRRLNLLWVVVDSTRSDSVERLLRENAAIARGFSEFALFTGYSTCSSRTHLVIAQLLDAARCDPRETPELGRGTLLEMLRAQGYRDELFAYYETQVRFRTRHHIADDRRLVELTRQALAAPSREPRALFLHLKGGHADYVAPGYTERERYENQIAASFEAIAELTRTIPKDDYAVIVIGDHGEAFAEHQSDAHASNLYEEVLRTPLFIRSPHLSPGPHTEALGCPDVTWKTLYALGILDRDPRPLGYQFAALELARERSTSAHSAGSVRSLRFGTKKVIWSPFLGIWEAYELARDPFELESLAETRVGDFAALRSKLEVLSRDCPEPSASHAMDGDARPAKLSRQ